MNYNRTFIDCYFVQTINSKFNVSCWLVTNRVGQVMNSPEFAETDSDKLSSLLTPVIPASQLPPSLPKPSPP